MKDRCIFKIAFIVSIFGIIGMFVFSGQISSNKYQIKEINPGMLDEEVSIEGVVVNIIESPKKRTYFLEIMDNSGKMNVVIFDKVAENIEKSNIKINTLINRRIKV
ncbi:MAG: DNA-binding protein, partial [Methanobacterium sp.]